MSDTPVSFGDFSTNSKSFLQGHLWFPSFELAEVFFSPYALAAGPRFFLAGFQKWQSPILMALQVAMWGLTCEALGT